MASFAGSVYNLSHIYTSDGLKRLIHSPGFACKAIPWTDNVARPSGNEIDKLLKAACVFLLAFAARRPQNRGVYYTTHRKTTMQLDMHYYGTYSMARAAGINPDTAQIIATCAQFVDDNTAKSDVTFRDGSRIDAEATAHHTLDINNIKDGDQRRVWVPFHFLPGNQGEGYTERLKCRKDSEVAQEMRDHHLGLADRAFAPALMGITAHVYSDTFSHYGFSGVSSRGNKVVNNSFRFHEEVEGLDVTIENLNPDMREYITGKASKFIAKPNDYHGGLLSNIVSWLGEEASGALGHGSVATYPDRPYLVWSFDYERDDYVANGITSIRNNPVTFHEGCHALYNMFTHFLNLQPEKYSSGDDRAFSDISERVMRVLLTQGPKQERIDAWQAAAEEGAIFGEPGERIPIYEGEKWNEQWENLDGQEDYHTAMETPIWHFYQASAMHRTYIIRDLLPTHGLIIN